MKNRKTISVILSVVIAAALTVAIPAGIAAAETGACPPGYDPGTDRHDQYEPYECKYPNHPASLNNAEAWDHYFERNLDPGYWDTTPDADCPPGWTDASIGAIDICNHPTYGNTWATRAWETHQGRETYDSQLVTGTLETRDYSSTAHQEIFEAFVKIGGSPFRNTAADLNDNTLRESVTTTLFEQAQDLAEACAGKTVKIVPPGVARVSTWTEQVWDADLEQVVTITHTTTWEPVDYLQIGC